MVQDSVALAQDSVEALALVSVALAVASALALVALVVASGSKVKERAVPSARPFLRISGIGDERMCELLEFTSFWLFVHQTSDE